MSNTPKVIDGQLEAWFTEMQRVCQFFGNFTKKDIEEYMVRSNFSPLQAISSFYEPLVKHLQEKPTSVSEESQPNPLRGSRNDGRVRMAAMFPKSDTASSDEDSCPKPFDRLTGNNIANNSTNKKSREIDRLKRVHYKSEGKHLTENDIATFFNKMHGPVLDVKWALARGSGEPLGLGHIDFEFAQDASNVIAQKDYFIAGVPFHVESYQPNSSRRITHQLYLSGIPTALPYDEICSAVKSNVCEFISLRLTGKKNCGYLAVGDNDVDALLEKGFVVIRGRQVKCTRNTHA